ncbi:GNAT family N-acetyltransferase [Culicoidibacter larvae]|uniref:GNAT family N-acetyltransferase n=2 Tax=Culicoidibacter larvae TaxID=2579976 RepID=A0A5R8QBP2_9FIRM|nr:GNAT family N-acetyltransferase [Culicoidibacter larvae]
MGEKKLDKVEVALANTMFCVCLYEDSKLIGFGRIVGDGAITLVVSDIMVAKDYQGQGLGKVIMQHIDDYLRSHFDNDAFVSLLATVPADQLYAQFGFYNSPDSIGMKRVKEYDN